MSVSFRHSLAWRMTLPIPLTVIGAVVVVWLLIPGLITSSATEQAVVSSRNIAEQFKTIREYYTENVVDKIVTAGTFQALVDHKGNDRAIPLPATMIHDLSALLTRQETGINLYSNFPFPNRKDRQLDTFQREAWEFLTKNPQQSYSRNEVRHGRHVVRVAVADTMAVPACVNCHNTIAASPKKDWRLGDVRGVLEIDSVIDSHLAYGAAVSRVIIGGSILLGLVLLGITMVVARSVTRPIEGLIGAMQKVGAGDVQVALPGIDRGDEIGRLAFAFDGMLSELTSARKREAAIQVRTTAMQSELVRVSRLTAMGQMSASIAHEINQPLAAIVTNANAGLRFLSNQRPDLDEARAALNQVVSDGHRAGDYIAGIRAMFKDSDGGKSPIDINEIVREVLLLVRSDLLQEQILVRTELADALPKVMAHRSQLLLVIRNLVMNAVDAMSSVRDRERLLHVRSESLEPSGVQVAVSDSGMGIDPGIMLRIFDDFFTTKPEGMGMGLSICRTIVTAHGGKLSASRCDPHGSVFQVVLPVARLDD